jgi:hypothetical protein
MHAAAVLSQMGLGAGSMPISSKDYTFFFITVGTVLLSVVSYWFLCHFVVHAPDVHLGAPWGALVGSLCRAHGTGIFGQRGSCAQWAGFLQFLGNQAPAGTGLWFWRVGLFWEHAGVELGEKGSFQCVCCSRSGWVAALDTWQQLWGM